MSLCWFFDKSGLIQFSGEVVQNQIRNKYCLSKASLFISDLILDDFAALKTEYSLDFFASFLCQDKNEEAQL